MCYKTSKRAILTVMLIAQLSFAVWAVTERASPLLAMGVIVGIGVEMAAVLFVLALRHHRKETFHMTWKRARFR